MLISQTIPEFVQWMVTTSRHKKSDGTYSQKTIGLYANVLTRLQAFLNDCTVDSINLQMLEDDMIHIGSQEASPRLDKKDVLLSGSTLQTHRLALNFFFDWAIYSRLISNRPHEHLPRPARNSSTTLSYNKEDWALFKPQLHSQSLLNLPYSLNHAAVH